MFPNLWKVLNIFCWLPLHTNAIILSILFLSTYIEILPSTVSTGLNTEQTIQFITRSMPKARRICEPTSTVVVRQPRVAHSGMIFYRDWETGVSRGNVWNIRRHKFLFVKSRHKFEFIAFFRLLIALSRRNAIRAARDKLLPRKFIYRFMLMN